MNVVVGDGRKRAWFSFKSASFIHSFIYSSINLLLFIFASFSSLYLETCCIRSDKGLNYSQHALARVEQVNKHYYTNSSIAPSSAPKATVQTSISWVQLYLESERASNINMNLIWILDEDVSMLHLSRNVFFAGT